MTILTKTKLLRRARRLGLSRSSLAVALGISGAAFAQLEGPLPPRLRRTARVLFLPNPNDKEIPPMAIDTPPDENTPPITLEQVSNSSIPYRSFADIQEKAVDWFWPGRIPMGRSTLIAGDPDLGKSQLTAYLAAKTTSGGEWPDGSGSAPKGRVLLLAMEDDLESTVKPRLMAAGADVTQVNTLENADWHRSKDALRQLEETIVAIGAVRLVILDPIRSFAAGINLNNPRDARAFGEDLAAIALRTGTAIVAIDHVSKKAPRTALHAVRGSVDFSAVFRAVLLVAKHPEDPDLRLLLPMKSNLGAAQGLTFFIERRVVGEGIVTSAIAFEGFTDITADEAFHPERKFQHRERRGSAVEFLKTALANGPIATNALNALGEGEGLSKRTLERARSDLGVTRAGKNGDGEWLIALPPKPASSGEDRHFG